MKVTVQILIVIVIGMSCSKRDNSQVETELRYYFDLFNSEANDRGITFNMEELDISGYIEDIGNRGTLGQCESYSSGDHAVVIDQDFWERATDLEKEYVVFHELGHCVLDRDHNDEANDSGVCNSIMQSGSRTCRGIYNESTRSNLLDELFDY